MRKNITLLFTVFILVLAGGFFAFRSFGEEKYPAAPEPVTVKIAPVIAGNASPAERFSGFVQGANQVTVSPKTSGYVVKMLKEEGDFVKAGETLAVLDGTELSAAKKAALLNLEATEKSAKKTEKYYEQKVDEAEANLKKAEKEFALGNATEQDVEVAEESVKSAKKLRDSQAAAQKSAVAQAQGQELISSANAGDIFVSAPFSGVITQKNISLGTSVSPGTAIYTMASPTELEINLAVPARLAKNLEKNYSVRITDSAGEKNASGVVFSISQAIGRYTQQSSLRVRFASKTEAQKFFLGEYVLVDIPQKQNKQALLIPESAVSYEYDDPFIFVVEGEKAKKRFIALGENVSSGQIVLAGLEENEMVVVEGLHNLKNEMPIQVYDNN